ncbi:MAG TPA: hypothetical protein VIN06_03915 [Devosia sp.]
MADALTTAQLDVLRRLRDGVELSGVPFIPNLLSELAFLRTFGLVEICGRLDATLTDSGRSYLMAAERQQTEAAAGRGS